MATDEAYRLSNVQGIILKSIDFLRRIIAPKKKRTKRCPDVVSLPKLQQFSLENYLLRVSAGKNTAAAGARAIFGENSNRKASNSLLVVQTGDSASQAKMLKAHAVPQGLCENFINELILFANSWNNGDNEVQSIVAGFFGKMKGIMEDLKNFLESVINHSTLDVGNLKESTRFLELRSPKFEKEGSEVSIREGPEELTFRTKEVGSQKSCAENKWKNLWLMLIGTQSARRSTKVLNVKTVKNCTSTAKETK